MADYKVHFKYIESCIYRVSAVGEAEALSRAKEHLCKDAGSTVHVISVTVEEAS